MRTGFLEEGEVNHPRQSIFHLKRRMELERLFLGRNLRFTVVMEAY